MGQWNNTSVEDYYNRNQILYNLFYSKGTGGVHYGFWDKDTRSISKAIINTNKFVARYLDLSEDDRVLDAGCGIGGTSIYLARNYGAKVVGITLSERQIKVAEKKVLKLELNERVKFFKQDYTKTDFRDDSFTKILGLESVCYADKKIDFLNEAFRLLKKGGKIVVADGFLIRTDFNRKESAIYHDWLNGWALPNLATKDSFQSDLSKAGFRNINYFDKFKEIRKTRDRIFITGVLGYPFIWFLYKLRAIKKSMFHHTIACILQKRIFSDVRNLGTYGVFVAEK
ncbi:class I SAM-dependent methyltransferase [candidate division WOR-3 bacterium]|nr:class I SAM-dependent methyltransferase [candidate division WOR-3 bacterium]